MTALRIQGLAWFLLSLVALYTNDKSYFFWYALGCTTFSFAIAEVIQAFKEGQR